jgi:hypothetical protein
LDRFESLANANKKADTQLGICFSWQRMRDSICIFALWGKNKGVAGPLPGQQHAPGVLHLDGFESDPIEH